MKSSAHLLHALVPMVIEVSILLVWPVLRWTQRLLLIASGLLTAVLVVMATLPALLLGSLELSIQAAALTGNNPRPAPWFLDWMVFVSWAVTGCLGLRRLGCVLNYSVV